MIYILFEGDFHDDDGRMGVRGLSIIPASSVLIQLIQGDLMVGECSEDGDGEYWSKVTGLTFHETQESAYKAMMQRSKQ